MTSTNSNIDVLVSLAKSYQSTKEQVWIDQHKYENTPTTKPSASSGSPKLSEKLMSVRNTIQNALSHTNSGMNSDVSNTVQILNRDMTKMNKLVQVFDNNLKNLEQRLNIMEMNTTNENANNNSQDTTQSTQEGTTTSSGMCIHLISHVWRGRLFLSIINFNTDILQVSIKAHLQFIRTSSFALK